MAKLIKFPLEMANGAKVRTLEDLKEHYDIASVIKYYKDGRLQRWLKANYQDEIVENLQESEKQSLRNIFSFLGLPEPSDEDLKNVDLRNISDTENSTATENENLKAEIKKYFKDASLLEDWNIFQNESDTKDKCVVEFENEKLQTFTGKFFEKGENFEKDVADFLIQLIYFHTKLTAPTAEIGDIAYSDGSVSKDYNSSKTPVGIVIEVKKCIATKIVSLDETEAKWSTENAITEARSETDGMANMTAIQCISDWEEKYPPFKWCDDYTDASGNSEWYLPAKDELDLVYKAKGVINAAIKKIITGGGVAKKLGSDYHWSSSQKYSDTSWGQSFNDGYQYCTCKNGIASSVRAVRAF